jgi:hypothetical protein
MLAGVYGRMKRYLGSVGLPGAGVRGDALDRPIFIWGAPCSGTGLLYDLVARHPAVGYLHDEGNRPREGTGVWWRAFGAQRGVMDASLIGRRRVNRLCAEYLGILEAQKKARLLDKTPFMILWIPLVNEVFPTARHFHIIRDGRAVVNAVLFKLRYSKKKRHRPYQEEQLLYGPYPPGLADPLTQPQAQRHARQWVQLVAHGRGPNREMLGDRYCELRYEDLVGDPRGVMRRALDHAQLEHDERFVLDAFPPELGNRNYKWQSGAEGVAAAGASDGYTERRALSDQDIAYLAEMVPMLRSLGYEDGWPGAWAPSR